ncbi:predicted protein [Lichtheimia corymbifera JMRC:FSU:9682]|uniref:Uncharacterized protein n=1 Tax=Lichtheimia corymbifera JMRC:FSU:9682 TaxID=1263082 RepID=A0A068RXH8_9FUNG|nr:predicted protein [Lichtheimia corymbifera JMRC:FSU:9682]
MLRMYSVMQLQQVWSNKPEAQEDVLPPTSPVNDVLPAVQEEAAEDDNDAAATGTKPSESVIGKDEDQKKDNATHDGEEALVSGKGDAVPKHQVDDHNNSESSHNHKRDSKMSAGSSSITDSGSKLAAHALPSPIVTRTTSNATGETSLPTTPISPKTSRSSQIQNKLASQRRSFSRRLKRTFSSASNNKG